MIGIVIFFVLVFLAFGIKIFMSRKKRPKDTSNETPAGGGHGGDPHHQTPAKKSIEDRVIGVVEIILTVIVILIGIMVIWFIYSAVQWLNAPPAPMQVQVTKKVQTFKVRESCTTPCKMMVSWGESIRSDGQPHDVTYAKRSYSVHYSGKNDESSEQKEKNKKAENPGEASFVSSDKDNPNIKIDVGHWEWVEIK